jgi:uridylate kinase
LSNSLNLNQIDGDYMGMMATVMNAIALRASLEAKGFTKVIIYSALEIPEISAKYNYHEAREKLAAGYVVIFGGGTGHALFTTDTAAALRAIEIKADALLMAKNGVAGVYDADPKTNPNAKFLEEIHYDEIFLKDLKVMDVAAATLAKKGNLVIEVFDMQEDNSLLKIAEGKIISTKIN